MGASHGKVKYNAIRIEFQVCGSPRLTLFLWVNDTPALSKCYISQYISFVNNITKTSLLHTEVNPELFHLALTC